MRQQSYKTFLTNEIQRLTGDNSRSIKKWASNSSARVKAAIIAYMLETGEYRVNSKDEVVKFISTEAFKISVGIDSEYERDAKRYIEYYNNYSEQQKYKYKLMDFKIDKKVLYSASLENNINYGNAFNFFVNKKASYLTQDKAQKILLWMMNKEK